MEIINPKEFSKSKTNLAGDLLRNSKTPEEDRYNNNFFNNFFIDNLLSIR